jgi:hypothetical protein
LICCLKPDKAIHREWNSLENIYALLRIRCQTDAGGIRIVIQKKAISWFIMRWPLK